MSDELPAGTVCYLTGLTEHAFLTGRVVEIAGRDTSPSDDPGDWYLFHAPWTPPLFQDREVSARRRNLTPISPQAPGLPALHTPARPSDVANPRVMMERLALDLAATERMVSEFGEQVTRAEAALAIARKMLLGVLWPRHETT